MNYDNRPLTIDEARKAAKKAKHERLEKLMALRLTAGGCGGFVFHCRFDSSRRHVDFAWPDKKVAIEVDGGVFVRGGHSRGMAQTRDYVKGNDLVFSGWRLFRVSTKHFEDGYLNGFVERIFEVLNNS